MKYIDEFRDRDTGLALAKAIARAVEDGGGRSYRFMEFCGGHTHAIFRFGLPDLLPPNIDLVHGPGCPVCVLPMARIEAAIQIAQQHGVMLCTYGDMLRVPGHKGMSLLKAKAAGADVRMVTSPLETLTLAQKNPDKQIVFFAIGFETTTPPTAVLLRQARDLKLRNFSVFCNHVLTPPALAWLLGSSKNADADTPELDGFIGPSHVSAIIGTEPYDIAARDYKKPVVIAGFEPLDVLQSVLMLVRQVNAHQAKVENEYGRAVVPDGNLKAKALMNEVFETRETFEWRGLGVLPKSGLKLRETFADMDAELRFPITIEPIDENRACLCPSILRGANQPPDCPLFGKVCTPDNPIGSCMVSSEGSCAAWYTYGRGKQNHEAA